MKIKSTFLAALFILTITKSIYSQVVIAKWAFPSTSADAIVDEYLGYNSGRFISCDHGEYGAQGYYTKPIDFTQPGANVDSITDDKCATVVGTHNGADSISWMIKFKPEGFVNMKLYSKQFSSINGPRDFKVQYKIGSTGAFTDFTTISCSNDWTTGVVSGISLPQEMENLVNTSIAIRWILTSNTSVQGGTVDSAATTSIDDIIISGDIASGMEDLVKNHEPKIFPNPSQGEIKIENLHNMQEILIFDIIGEQIFLENEISDNYISINNLPRGIYIVRIVSKDFEIFTEKLIIN